MSTNTESRVPAMSGADRGAAFWRLAAAGSTRAAIDHALSRVAAGETVDRVILDTLVPTQQHVGTLWERNEWTVADEHVATAVVDGVLGALGLQTVVPTPPRGTILVGCVEGEHHTLPARMGVERLRAAGWEATFLGGSVGAHDLQCAAALAEPRAVVLSCTVPLFLAGAGRCIGAIADLGLPVVAAGAGFGETPSRADRLGASGWVSQNTDLSLTMQQALARERSTPDPHPEAIALELRDEDLREECLGKLPSRIPAIPAFSSEQLAHTRTDLDSILDHLGVALDMDEPELFAAFVVWLTRLHLGRGLPPSVLDTSLDTLAGVLSSAGLLDAALLCGSEGRTRVRSS